MPLKRTAPSERVVDRGLQGAACLGTVEERAIDVHHRNAVSAEPAEHRSVAVDACVGGGIGDAPLVGAALGAMRERDLLACSLTEIGSAIERIDDGIARRERL